MVNHVLKHVKVSVKMSANKRIYEHDPSFRNLMSGLFLLFLLQNWEKKKFNHICVVSEEKNYPSNNYTFHIACNRYLQKQE